jgi:hypothetical protein
MPFCSNCGQPIQSDNKFCASCGSPLQAGAGPMPNAPPVQPPPQPIYQNVQPPAYYPPPPPAYPVEIVKFAIGNLAISKSWGRTDAYTLIVTQRRSIFAKYTQEIINEILTTSRAKAQAEGKGFFGKWGAQMKEFGAYQERYLHFTPDQVLQETPGNFAIENAWIRRIKITENSDEDTPTQYGITFETVNQKLYFKSGYDLGSQFKQAYGPAIVH